ETHGYFRFRLRGPGWATGTVELGVPGAFNVGNAALAIALAVGLAGAPADRESWSDLGRAVEAAAAGIGRYRGAERRVQARRAGSSSSTTTRTTRRRCA